VILVTGGLGFIGSHTVNALLDADQECVLVQRRTELPANLVGRPVVVESGNITDLERLRAIGRAHRITGIVHLAGSMPWPRSPEAPVARAQTSLGSLFNVIQVAQEWEVARVCVASTIGVYAGATNPLEGPLTEDKRLAITGSGARLIPTFKKVGELLGGYLADVSGVDVINLRISGTWGPLGHPDPFFPAPELIHAAAGHRAPDFGGVGGRLYAEDALDLCYVKDTGRAIASLALADRLNHRTYNVASGCATTNAEIAAAIKQVIPDAQVDLPSGGDGPKAWLDISRLREDCGYQPAWDTERAAADYIAWLQAGNER
jgi:UDP-glucose 4-epimerase